MFVGDLPTEGYCLACDGIEGDLGSCRDVEVEQPDDLVDGEDEQGGRTVSEPYLCQLLERVGGYETYDCDDGWAEVVDVRREAVHVEGQVHGRLYVCD